MMAATVMLTVLGMSSKADSQVIVIRVTPSGNIDIDKKFVGVCKGSNPNCASPDQMLWTVHPGSLSETQRIVIENVENRIACFPEIPITFPHTNGLYPLESSGPPEDICTWDKFGVYWPYIVELQEESTVGADDWTVVKSTDPGGIIFP
jgi:hypothetical protein